MPFYLGDDLSVVLVIEMSDMLDLPVFFLLCRWLVLVVVAACFLKCDPVVECCIGLARDFTPFAHVGCAKIANTIAVTATEVTLELRII